MNTHQGLYGFPEEEDDKPKKKLTRAKRKALRVTFPGEEPICYNNVTETFIMALKKIPAERYPEIRLEISHIPVVANCVYLKYKDLQKPLGNGWYVLIQSDTEHKYRQLLVIKEQLGLDCEIELGEFETTKFEGRLSHQKKSSHTFNPDDNQTLIIGGDEEALVTEEPVVRQPKRVRGFQKLLVKMPDGTYIAEPSPIDTYIQTLWALGLDMLERKDLILSGRHLITKSQIYDNQMQVGVGQWATFPNTTKEKTKWLRVVAAMTGIKMEVTLL